MLSEEYYYNKKVQMVAEYPSGYGSKVFFADWGTPPELRALSVGYEAKQWRCKELASLMFAALPDFALNYSERATLHSANAYDRLVKAATLVYTTEKYGKRGEFGELLLHLVMVDYYDTLPAVSKIYYKDGTNDTVKGFDAVHVVVTTDGLELWLGETKFYDDIGNAINHVVEELRAHTQSGYLRKEFICITNKIDVAWPHADKLKQLINPKVSLDRIFSRIKIPVLLTYNSGTVKNFREECTAYEEAFREEVSKYHTTFRGKNLPQVDIVLILVPLEDKVALVDLLHTRLKGLQQA